MIDTTLADFNVYMRNCGARTFLVAGRCFDLAPNNWEFLSCAWYERNGLLELANDRYIGKHPTENREMVRYKSVDEIVANPPKELVGIGRHFLDGWIARKKELDQTRKADPVVILPPPPNPPMPKVEPKPEPKPDPQPEPKKPSVPFLQRFKGFAKIAAGLGAIMAGTGWAIKLFLPGLGVKIWDMIQMILETIGRMS